MQDVLSSFDSSDYEINDPSGSCTDNSSVFGETLCVGDNDTIVTTNEVYYPGINDQHEPSFYI